MFQIGNWDIQHPTILAPMAGITDAPFRHVCRQLGVGMTVSEMITSDERLWSRRKSQQRLSLQHRDHNNKQQELESNITITEPRSVQLAVSS